MTRIDACPRVSETTSSGTPMAKSSEAHEWRNSWMLQWPSPAATQNFGTVLPKASGSSGVPMVDVKIRLAEFFQSRAVRRSSCCRTQWACNVSTTGWDR
ncbi:MAG TPA: hypothetical protein VGG38_11155 [Acidimicrobiales bacterium]